MSEECNHDCSSCASDCADRQAPMKEAPHELSQVGKVIGVVSGKGGVGKSLVTSMLAVAMRREGYRTAILDADITGPSIPKAFGIKNRAFATEAGIFPVETSTGIEIMSVNLLLENDTDPVIWRGPIIGGTVKQFWTDVIWGDVDYMFVDMPPGTGDVPLTVFQSVPVDGIIVVASPQELVGMIVEKAVKMADMMNVPVLALVENMSYFECPDCGKHHYIFGESHISEIAQKHNIKTVCQLPVDPAVASLVDGGRVEELDTERLSAIIELLKERQSMKIAVTYDNGEIFQHFGHTEAFKIYEVSDTGEIISASVENTNGSGHGALAGFLQTFGVDCLICGGIGQGAKNALAEAGIQVFGGVSGNADEAIKAFVTGTLDFDPNVHCSHHDNGEHDCGGEHHCGGHGSDHHCGHHA